MKLSFKCLSFAAAPVTACALLVFAPGGLVLPAPGCAQATDDRAEVLTRGPVHEAFAGTISFKAVTGFPVPQAPPAVVDELPPEHRPAGDNVTWISGYWAWDEEAAEFIWVSGIWRNLPPGRQWIPGYWWESGRDHQWISGYWADAAADEIVYLDEPPASLEKGPNIKSPSRNHSWIPGTWRYRNSRYAWQGGYWDEARPDWIWTPSYYTNTPRGYIYVDGYYDYNVSRRGVIFAPVRFQGQRYTQDNYHYRPTSVISVTAVVNHLFLRPRARHYYFGDYYAPEYRQNGYYPSSNYYTGGHGYDPIFAHERWTHRADAAWERRVEENFTYYRDHQAERPPHTLAAFNLYYERPGRNRRVEQGFVTGLDQMISRRDTSVQFLTVGQSEQEVFTRRSRELRDYGEERRKSVIGIQARIDTERSGSDKRGKRDNPPPGPTRVKMERSPVLAPTAANASAAGTPPSRPAAAPLEETTAKTGNAPEPKVMDPLTGKAASPLQPGDTPANPPGGEKSAGTDAAKANPDMNRVPKGQPESNQPPEIARDPKNPDPARDPKVPNPSKDARKPATETPGARPDKDDPAVDPPGPDGKPPREKTGENPEKGSQPNPPAPPIMPADPKRDDQSPQDPAAPKPGPSTDPKRGPDSEPATDKLERKPLGDKKGRAGNDISPKSPDKTGLPPGRPDSARGQPQNPDAEPRREGQDKDGKQGVPRAHRGDKATPETQPRLLTPEPQPEPKPRIPSPDAGPGTKPMPNSESRRERPNRGVPAPPAGRPDGPAPRRDDPTPESRREAASPGPRPEAPAPEPLREKPDVENRRERPKQEPRQEQPRESKPLPRRESEQIQPRSEAPPQAPAAEPNRPPQREKREQREQKAPREERQRPQADPTPQTKPQAPAPVPPGPPGPADENSAQAKEKRKKD